MEGIFYNLQQYLLNQAGSAFFIIHLLEQELLPPLLVLWGAVPGGAGVPVHRGGRDCGVKHRASVSVCARTESVIVACVQVHIAVQCVETGTTGCS